MGNCWRPYNAPQRWIYIGAAGISGPWLIVVMVIIWTGLGNNIMGLEGESLTSEVLREFRSEGWVLINGIKIKRKSDIDHILVGPKGVFVIESKWSHEPWLMRQRKDSFMWDRLLDAVEQTKTNLGLVKWRFGNELQGVEAQGVCVLWSNKLLGKERGRFDYEGILVVRGSSLADWMKSLASTSLDELGVERVVKAIERQALSHDELEYRKSDGPIPTVNQFIFRALVAPLMGFTIAFAGIVVVSKAHSLWIIGISLVSFIVIGLVLRRISSLRVAARGWLAACAVFCGLFVVVAIQYFTR
ncbi:MAG: NERD domain-containing protein [Actinobacteria bacterium]|nr:NERD domain-containing protein [Actinomycetota bacterium]